ncbi:helix-turn-helix transcriptional regulator [Carboxylicivirga sediminis]|uniref:Helix-turn-helix transcriptional regulator n=1 Tax=Carboxylicivirga sediminis TaxID=2006564 RepID=A0A941EYA2_9BACT|nr:AraC family transcriptional regulator [Carboxylicivirga sediminis]MBR8534081.1 helix-turn-helix transcriptional regulator [Carboxylicivirga sediminis]
MNNENTLHLKVKEGITSNYLDALQAKIGGTRVENRLDYHVGNSRLSISYYNLIPEFEVTLAQLDYHQKLIVEREPDDRADYFHFNMVNQGQIKQHIDNKEQYTEAGASNGVFIYNGLFPLKSFFPAKGNTQSMAFKFSKKAFDQLMPESLDLLNSLFPDAEPLAYHTAINSELAKELKDLFYYENTSYGRTPNVMSVGLKLFPILMQSLKTQLDKDELNGLHLEDYNRIVEVKDYLLANLNQIIKVENIAEMHHISLSKLKRDFKSLYDVSIYKFYTHAKMDEAYRRLKTGQYSVTEVGFDLGYSSLSKFSEMFKKVKGINPKDVVPL